MEDGPVTMTAFFESIETASLGTVLQPRPRETSATVI